MRKILLGMCLLALISANVQSQSISSSFFSKVSYVGAFDGVTNWAEGWVNWDPVNTNYPETYTSTKGNGQFTRSGGLHITANETWSGTIKLDGWVYVDAGATLTIQPGTIIRGTNKSVLCIERGGKIMAVGTRPQPIVFTSSQGAGFRTNSDWGGLVICGNGVNNLASGAGVAEGGIGSEYGGTNNEDNSGVLAYVRIEFPGYEVATGSEVNGLTLNSVGNGTRIEYVQVSYSGDDGFEWFGGAVNAKYLISYRTEDDDFDTDNGYSGMVQFGLIMRDPAIVDTDTANAFESDNNSSGTELTPLTKAIFSNISAFGASKDLATYTSNPQNHKDGAAMRIRRASRISIYNSLFLGWGRGVRLESSPTHAAAVAGELVLKNNIIGGIYGNKYGDASTMTVAQIESWYLDAANKNKMLASDADAKIANPFNLASPNFQPQVGSPVFNASYWYVPGAPNSIDNIFFSKVSYVGAFDGVTNWAEGWVNWDPVNTNYPETYTSTKGNGQFTRSGGLHITANETWSGTIKLDGWVYVDAGATLTIQPGTIIRGTNKSVLCIERGGKIMAVGTRPQPIVFTSSQGAGFRTNSDWGGLVICGNGVNNLASGAGVAEGGIGSEYGGTNNEDNSGVLAYVRIEFPGYEVATGSEVNGLTLNSVGNGTRIEYVQVSYSGDDGFEWFGGAVNAKYLISYRTEDDDFDTDNGYSGMVQFGLIMRDPAIVDTDTANAFESDNNSSGTELTPLTKAIFSNISAFGASKDLATYTSNPQNHKDGAAMRIRRASRISIYNSLFLGWGRGVRLESSPTHAAAVAGELVLKNNIIGGIYGNKYGDASTMTVAQIESWYLDAANKNKMLASDADAKIANPFNLASPNFQPQVGSPVFNASYWFTTSAKPTIVSSETKLVNYPNPFSGTTNIELQLEKASYVRVSVIDMAGRTVANLQEGKLTEGKHRFVFDGTALPKGLYFAKVVNGSDQKVVKMISK